jgi:hypothetical protein
LSKLIRNLYVLKKKVAQKYVWAYSIIFKKLCKVNNRPFGLKFAQSGHPDCKKNAAEEIISFFSAHASTILKLSFWKINIELRSIEKSSDGCTPGLPDVTFFVPKIRIWVYFWRVLEWKLLLNFMVFGYVL